jgi:hypothetical protein
MLIIKVINLCFLALIFAMPIMYPNVEVREYPNGPKLPREGDEDGR